MMSENSTTTNSIKKRNTKERLQRLTVSAVFIALSCIAKFFQITIPVLGATGLHISAAGIFSTLPALAFGPLYGGAVAGIVDVIGFFMTGGKDGPFVPVLTVTAILCGILKGVCWSLLLKVKQETVQKKIKVVWGIFFSLVVLIGIWNLICVSFLPGFYWTSVLQRLGKKVAYGTYGLLIIGVGGLLCMLLAKLLNKWTGKWNSPYLLQLFGTLAIANITVTTLNTFILMDLYHIKAPFLVFFIPRLIEELIMVVLQAFLISWILVPVKKIGDGILPKGRL